jgi:hypothetical protein
MNSIDSKIAIDQLKKPLEARRKDMFYSALLLYKASVGKNHDELLYEEKVLLIEARNEEEALDKAQHIAKDDYVAYLNMYGDKVTWSPVQVLGVCEIIDSNLTNGTELHSRYFTNLEDYQKVEPRAGKKQEDTNINN